MSEQLTLKLFDGTTENGEKKVINVAEELKKKADLSYFHELKEAIGVYFSPDFYGKVLIEKGTRAMILQNGGLIQDSITQADFNVYGYDGHFFVSGMFQLSHYDWVYLQFDIAGQLSLADYYSTAAYKIFGSAGSITVEYRQ